MRLFCKCVFAAKVAECEAAHDATHAALAEQTAALQAAEAKVEESCRTVCKLMQAAEHERVATARVATARQREAARSSTVQRIPAGRTPLWRRGALFADAPAEPTLAALVPTGALASRVRAVESRAVSYVEYIGDGGFGTVALVRVRDILYARKQVRGDVRREDSPARLAREAELAASLSHDNIVAVRMVVTVAGQIDAVLFEYAARGSLSRVIQREASMPSVEKVRLSLGIACGLEHMHSQSPPVAHFDLKPENILVDASGCPKLTDFGLSREIAGHHTGFPGTPGFLAPEIVAQKAFSLPADVYSLGCVLVCVDTWDRRCMKDPAKWLHMLGTESDLRGIISVCMHHCPTDRPIIKVVRVRLTCKVSVP